MNIYEYLFAGLIVVLLLTASTIMVATISTPANNAADKNDLSIVAEKVMTQIMLDSGYPQSWGNSSAEPQVFGLAKCGQISRQAYELDPDKVQRLDSTNPDYLKPRRAVELLNLANTQGAAEYGFTLQFNDSLHITTPTQLGPANADNYSVTVTSEYQLPVSGAKTSATLYYIDTRTAPCINHTATLHGATADNGIYVANFNSSTTAAKVLVLTVDYYGVQVTKFYQLASEQQLQATLYQNELVANTNQQYNIPTDADAREILVTYNNGTYGTNDIAVQNAGTPTNFTVAGTLEPSAEAVLAITGSTHNQLVLATRDFSHISYQTINFTGSVPAGKFAYSLERTVVIGGSVYTATLYLWRMSF